MTGTGAISPATRLSESEWWKSAVVYQVYPRSFADSNGDGIGDLRGLIGRLDYLERLGIDVIWLSPIYRSPHDDNGYDVSDYQAIDPLFGTLEEFDELVTDLHARGMKLIMDLVVNHTSDEHPWFVESASSVHSAKRDWYWWRSPRGTAGDPGSEPNNWASFFSGSAWQLDAASGEYYLHLFSRKQPDLNWENPEVRQAIYDMMRWWLDRGVDGFRMDVINLISKEPSLPDGIVAEGAAYGNGFPFYSYGPRIHEFLREMNDAVFAGRADSYLTVGEMPGVTVDQARMFTDPDRREVNMVFQFEHVGLDHGVAGKFDPQPLDLVELKRSLSRWQDGLAEVGWNSLYWNNHDQPRAVSRFGDDQTFRVESAKALAALLHLQRGTPYIYQGEELGMTNMPFETIDEFRDIESINHYASVTADGTTSPQRALASLRTAGRDNARTPVQWSAAPQAGFTTGVPWIRVHPNHIRVNAESQVGQVGSIFEFYRALILLRHSEPAIVNGTSRMIALDHPKLFAFERRDSNTRILVAANCGANQLEAGLELRLDRWADAEVVLGNYPEAAIGSPLRAWEVRVLRVRT